MAQYLSQQQHQMLEDLTGLQHTRTGQVRQKQNRSERETRRLGLESNWSRQWRAIVQRNSMPQQQRSQLKNLVERS
jgi:hypothetical protein